MAEPVRHRQTKGAATDMFDLPPPRHISTLRSAGILGLQPEGLRCAGTGPPRDRESPVDFDRSQGLALRVTDFEHAVGCLRNSACSLSVSLIYRKVQARQKQLAVIGVPQIAEIGDYNRGHGTQPKDDISRVVEPAHMGVAGSEITVGERVTRVLLDRAQQDRYRLIETPTDKMRGADPHQRRTDASARAET